eukprot:scaffold147405_cov42-Attheya_sp.AAC.4
MSHQGDAWHDELTHHELYHGAEIELEESPKKGIGLKAHVWKKGYGTCVGSFQGYNHHPSK